VVTFPLETEAAIRRRMYEICQDHARNAVEITRELAQMIDGVKEGKHKIARIHYEEMLKLLEESGKSKINLLEEVASVGSLLISREDFMRLIFGIEEIADYAEGVGFRLVGILDRKWKVDKKYVERISDLASLVLEEITRLRETILSLSFSPSKAMELTRTVEEVERKIDSSYRTLDIEILDAKMPMQSVLILRDIVEHLERMADLAVDVGDLVRVLAISG
jgi:uncharacterized protein Yka (UPF0111/DUF47 family)